MSNLVTRARLFAIEAHADTKYGNLPYEHHLAAVVRELRSHCIVLTDEDFAAAWLHDVVEDTDVTLGDIRTEFGGRVARLVDAVTDEPGHNRAARKAGMYKKLVVAPVSARAIKLADRLANMKASIENPSMSRMYRDEFPEFIKKAGQDYENRNIVLELLWVYVDSVISGREEVSKKLDESLALAKKTVMDRIEKSGRTAE